MFDLDKLYKQYLIYKLKRLFLPFIVIIALGSVFYFGYTEFFTQKSVQVTKSSATSLAQTKKEHTPPKVSTTKHVKVKKKVSTKDEKHYKFFTLSVREKNRSTIENVQKKYAKFGLECRIDEQNNYLNLVCGETNSQKESKKIKALLEKHHIKYYLVTKKEIPVTDKLQVKKEKTPQKSSHIIKPISKTKLALQEKKEIIINKEPTLNISHSDVDLDALKRKFSQHESYGIAIRIAQEYYTQENYKASLKWAKKANNLDRKKEKSWVLYAKSLYKLGKKAKAIQVLKLYKRFSSSQEVNRILQEWEQDDK